MLIRAVERLLAVRRRSLVPAGALWIILLAVPTAAREALTPLLSGGAPFATFYPAVLIAGLLLPRGAAWSFWIATGLVAQYFFLPPRFALGVDGALLTTLMVYYVSSALVVTTGTALRTAVTRLQGAKEREELLNGELLHRVKNVFSLVQSVAFQAAKKSGATPEGMREEIDGWLIAMSGTADLLASREWQSCDLEKLTGAVLSPFSKTGQIVIDGCHCEIAADGAEPLTLCLHELATNAVKYGALSGPEGRVIISWEHPQPKANVCSIQWQELNGPVVDPPARRGFGSRVLKAQRGLLAVTVHFERAGLRCEMSVRVIDCK